MDGETEVEKGRVTCPMLPSQPKAKPGLRCPKPYAHSSTLKRLIRTQNLGPLPGSMDLICQYRWHLVRRYIQIGSSLKHFNDYEEGGGE